MTASRTYLLAAAAAVGGSLAAGCVDDTRLANETTSLHVDVMAPADLGTFKARLAEPVKSVTVEVTAYDIHGQLDVGFSRQVQAYAQFMGTLTPALGSIVPLARIDLVDGVSQPVTIAMPAAYGATELWVEDGGGDAPTWATGASDTIWHHEPYISNVSTPAATQQSQLIGTPLEGKQVTIATSRHGARGRLVVTSTYSQGYTISDVECADEAGTPPCVAGDFDHLLVYTFSAPASGGRALLVGDTVKSFGGGVQEFNGLTELEFPQTTLGTEPTNPARVPAPLAIDTDWFDDTLTFEKAEAGLVSIAGGTICATDNDYVKYGQWKVDIVGNCSTKTHIINIVTAGVLPFDPSKATGKKLGKTIGALRPVNFASGGSVWIIYPRSAADIQLPN